MTAATVERCDDCGTGIGELDKHNGTLVCRHCYSRRAVGHELHATPGIMGASAPHATPSRRRDGGQAAVVPSKLRRLDVSQMVRENPPPVPWVIERLVVRGALTVLNGREGEGKSLLAMALAAGVAHGENQAGLTCHAGRVLIVDTENGQYETHRRVHALGLPGSVEMYEPDDGKRFDLRTDLKDLDRLLHKHKPDLLVLDSFRTLWGGEENDSGEVAKVLDPLRNLVRKHKAGTILLHHSGKTNGSYRGSSAIGASAELGFTLARDDGDEDRERRSLACWKCRPAPKPVKAWIRLSVDRGMVLVDQAEPPEEQEAGPAAGPVTSTLRPQVLQALTDRPQSRADVARAVGRDTKDRSVGRVLGDLHDEGIADKSGPDTRPLWKVAGGKTPRADATCHLREVPADGLGDLSPERPSTDLADALQPTTCRCERPLPAPDEDGNLRCTRCGHACAGWGAAS